MQRDGRSAAASHGSREPHSSARRPLGPSSGRRRSRALDPLLRWALTGLAALILLLIAFFFIRLFIEAKPAFDQFGYLGFVFDNNWDVSKEIFGAWPLRGRAR